MTEPLAHAGHWATSLIYLAPLVAFGAWLGFDALRRRAAGPPDDPGSEAEGEGAGPGRLS